MILGVGIDIVDINSFREQLSDLASRFIFDTFTPRERATVEARGSGDLAHHLATRYAAKEAFIKAWSCARWGNPPLIKKLSFHEIEVISDQYGRPLLRIHGRVAKALKPFAPYRLNLSLSHDGNWAAAVVLIETSAPNLQWKLKYYCGSELTTDLNGEIPQENFIPESEAEGNPEISKAESAELEEN